MSNVNVWNYTTTTEESEIKFLASKFNKHDFYLVGGSVRDMFLGLKPKDYDFATNLNPEQIKDIFKTEPAVKLLEVGVSFGVVKVLFPKSQNQYEIATFREDFYNTAPKGSGATEVKFSTIENDVFRRDFTINALFLDVKTGSIVDLVGGLDDIKNNIVRAVGEPKLRFEEDRLRILRAIRFAARFKNASLHPDTASVISENSDLFGISRERIREEFIKGVASSHSAKEYLKLLHSFQLISQIFPNCEITTNLAEFPSTNNKYVPHIISWLLPEINESNLRKGCFTLNEIKETLFYSQLKQNIFNPYRLKKQQDLLGLTNSEVKEWTQSWIYPTIKQQAFAEYQITTAPLSLMEEGFSGSLLGQELEKRELVLFETLLATLRK